MVQKVDERPAARDVSAEGADGLRERAHLDVDAAVHLEVIDRPAAVFTEHAAGMRVVDHHDAAEFFRQRAEGGHRPEIAVHAEDAVRNEQLAL